MIWGRGGDLIWWCEPGEWEMFTYCPLVVQSRYCGERRFGYLSEDEFLSSLALS
jgi:hypothetical protein